MSINPAEKIMPEPRYSADDIVVLKGLEPVRRRPGLYVGDTQDGSGLRYMVYGIVGNAIDWLANDRGQVTVTLNADGSVTVDDNGCGLPTDIHPQQGISAAEIVMTQLYCGGAFDRSRFSGVCAAAVNALSSRLDLTIWRDGKEHAMSFENGVPLAPLKVVGDAHDRTGTQVRFVPSGEIFASIAFDYELLTQRLRELAFFHAGLTIILKDARGVEPVSETMEFPAGLKDFVRHLDARRTPLLREPIEASGKFDGIAVEAAFWWNSGIETDVYAYANHARQSDGGTHLTGFLAALTPLLSDSAGNAITITNDDVRNGLTGVVSVTMDDWPRFDGASRDKLASPEVHPVVQNAVSEAFAAWLATHPNDAKAILQKIAASARRREAGEQLAGALANISE
jgi:DNA gyrase subunit B